MAIEEQGAALIVTVSSFACAIPLQYVTEVMRPLPTDALAGAPPFIRGLAIIRGTPTVVVDLRLLLEPGAPPPAGRYVALKIGQRPVAAAVDDVRGIRVLNAKDMVDLPSLLRGAGSDVVETVGAQDAALLLMLRASRIVPNDVWALLEAREAAQ